MPCNYGDSDATIREFRNRLNLMVLFVVFRELLQTDKGLIADNT